jgi:5'-3' exonuclease
MGANVQVVSRIALLYHRVLKRFLGVFCMKDILVFDLSNLAYVSAHRPYKGVEFHPNGPELVLEASTQYMRILYKRFNPDCVIFACDHSHYWRREIFPAYKGHRELNALKVCVRAAIAKFKEKNAPLCVEHEGCEADDVVYAVTQFFPEDRVTVVSSDSDFLQLPESVRLFCPRKRNFYARNEKPAFDLFIKCFRGDSADNIPSAYPRISSKKLRKAFDDVALKERLWNTVLKEDPVKVQFDTNQQLIDLSCLPQSLLDALQAKLKALAEANNIEPTQGVIVRHA